MSKLSNDVLSKIKQLTDSLNKEFIRKGRVIPSENEDGSVNFGNYVLSHMPTGSFRITDYSGEVIVDQINLPHAAIIIANDLAVGKFINQQILEQDRHYGYALFEESVCDRQLTLKSKRSTFDFDLALAKKTVSHQKRVKCRRAIINSFRKLHRNT